LPARKPTNIIGAVKGVCSENTYKSLEATVESIIELRLEEEGKSTRDLIRIKSMRNVHFPNTSRWRPPVV